MYVCRCCCSTFNCKMIYVGQLGVFFRAHSFRIAILLQPTSLMHSPVKIQYCFSPTSSATAHKYLRQFKLSHSHFAYFTLLHILAHKHTHTNIDFCQHTYNNIDLVRLPQLSRHAISLLSNLMLLDLLATHSHPIRHTHTYIYKYTYIYIYINLTQLKKLPYIYIYI